MGICILIDMYVTPKYPIPVACYRYRYTCTYTCTRGPVSHGIFTSCQYPVLTTLGTAWLVMPVVVALWHPQNLRSVFGVVFGACYLFRIVIHVYSTRVLEHSSTYTRTSSRTCSSARGRVRTGIGVANCGRAPSRVSVGFRKKCQRLSCQSAATPKYFQRHTHRDSMARTTSVGSK